MSEKQKPTIVFMGTPDFSSVVLESLFLEGYPILAVVTQPDFPAKNNQEAVISPVKKFALEKNIPVSQPEKLDDEFKKWLKDLKPDLIIVAAFGKILPEDVLNIPKFRSINVHPSLLPILRGASPIQNALVEGFTQTGTTIMLMDKGMDTGEILSQEQIKIEPEDDYITLTGKLAILSSKLLIETIPAWIDKKIQPQKQDNSKATLCQLIEKSDGKINWNESSQDIFNKFRAFKVWPGIFSFWENKNAMQKISFTQIALKENKPADKHKPGEIFQYSENKFGVQTLDGVIIIQKLQLAGKNETDIKDFLNGYPQFIGSILK